MSILSDSDFALHAFRLNYIRRVLPSHAAGSQLAGTGPYNLISFNLPSSSTTLQSPYVQLSGMADETHWTELRCGRESPPLGTGRRREAVGSSLQHSKTIGKYSHVAGATSAAGYTNRRRSKSNTSKELIAVGGDDSDLAGVNRRRSLEKTLHLRRIASSSNIIAAAPPPVVVHSPVRTPSLLRHLDQSRPSLVSIDTVKPVVRSKIDLDLDDAYGSPESEDATSPRPLSLISETFESSPQLPSLLPLTPSNMSISAFPSTTSLSSLAQPSSSLSSLSSISDTESRGHRDRHDSEASLMVPAPAAIPVEEAPRRERRRVNISGKMFVPVMTAKPEMEAGTDTELLAVPARRPSSRASKPIIALSAIPVEPPLKTSRSMSSTSFSANATRTPPPLSFAKASLASSRPPPPTRSALTNLMNTLSEPDVSFNPFSTFYGALSSQASDALSLSLYFPSSKEPRKRLTIRVRKDLSVEEVIGVGLWAYCDQAREPPIEVTEGEEERETTKWNLRIVEDDGEVDEDFPALDRSRAISAFAFGEFALVKATAAQIKENRVKQSKIRRRPSRILASSSSKVSRPVPSSNGNIASALSAPVLLHILLPQMAGFDGVTITLGVARDMRISDVVEGVCSKRGINDPREWALLQKLNGGGEPVLVAPERTVESLGDTLNLSLVRKQDTSPAAPTTQSYDLESALATSYRRYSVYRKLPMPLGRHARTIAVDIDYIHFLPAENRGMFDVGKTVNYHVSAIIECRVSKRSKGSFKILVQKDRGVKRYDFEGETVKQTAEVVKHINSIMSVYRRR